MVVVRILQRRDAASLVVAIAAGLVVGQFVSSITNHLSDVLSGVDSNASFKTAYWQPIVTFVLQLVVLEILARLAVAARAELVRKR